jgi:hypothetical protein
MKSLVTQLQCSYASVLNLTADAVVRGTTAAAAERSAGAGENNREGSTAAEGRDADADATRRDPAATTTTTGGGGGGGETAFHTTPFAWCTPFLKDFPVVTLHPRFPFNVRLTGKTFD